MRAHQEVETVEYCQQRKNLMQTFVEHLKIEGWKDEYTLWKLQEIMLERRMQPQQQEEGEEEEEEELSQAQAENVEWMASMAAEEAAAAAPLASPHSAAASIDLCSRSLCVFDEVLVVGGFASSWSSWARAAL